MTPWEKLWQEYLKWLKNSPIVKVGGWLVPPAGIKDETKAIEEEIERRKLEKEERERQKRKNASPKSQTIPKPPPAGLVPKTPKAPPVAPIEADDDITPSPPAVSKPKQASTLVYPPPPQKPIWDNPIEALRRFVMPPGSNYISLGQLIRYNYIKGDTIFSRWQGLTNPPDYFNQWKLSYSNYLAWLARKTGAASPELGDMGGQVDQFWDQSATIWFNNSGQMDSRKGLIYGIECLGIIFQEYWISSRTAQFGSVRGMLYESISVESYPVPWSRDLNNNLEELDSNSGEGLAFGLAMYAAQSGNLEPGEGDGEPRVILENSGGGIGGGVGADDAFPIRVPVSLLIEDEDLKDMSEQEIQEKAYTKVKSLPELILWFVRVFDEVMGKFPLTFEIGESDMLSLEEEMETWEQSVQKDGLQDPSLPFYLQNDKLVSFSMKDGRRVKRIKVPNLAEALSELSALALVNDQQSALGQEFLLRLLQESGSTKQTAIQTYYMADAIIDWLGFATKEKTEEVDFSWQPNFDDKDKDLTMRDLLTPSKVPVIVLWENEKETFQKIINVIIEAHAILKAAHTEGLGATPTQLANRIRKFSEAFEPDPTVKKEAKPGEVIDETITSGFDEFLERVEKGFIDAPLISDNQKPYGKPYGQRPKIKRVEGNLID